METRTELILLQRTMVVVEGVARSLDPHINIWQVARPVVEDYIKKSVGPAALVNDLLRTVRVLSRFGPKLPEMVEDALVRSSEPEGAPAGSAFPQRALWFICGAGAAVLGAYVLTLL